MGIDPETRAAVVWVCDDYDMLVREPMFLAQPCRRRLRTAPFVVSTRPIAISMRPPAAV